MAWTESQKQLLVEVDRMGHLISELDEGLERMQKIVRDGNGEEPLVKRMTLIEERLNMVRESLARGEERRWQLWLALIASFAMPIVVGFILYEMLGAK